MWWKVTVPAKSYTRMAIIQSYAVFQRSRSIDGVEEIGHWWVPAGFGNGYGHKMLRRMIRH